MQHARSQLAPLLSIMLIAETFSAAPAAGAESAMAVEVQGLQVKVMIDAPVKVTFANASVSILADIYLIKVYKDRVMSRGRATRLPLGTKRVDVRLDEGKLIATPIPVCEEKLGSPMSAEFIGRSITVAVDAPQSFAKNGDKLFINFDTGRLTIEKEQVLWNEGREAKLLAGTKKVEIKRVDGKLQVLADGVLQTPTGPAPKPPAPTAVPFVAFEQYRSDYPVGSLIKDERALGGFGSSGNYPFDLGDKDWGKKGEVSVVAFPNEPATYIIHRGIVVRVINRTDEVIAFNACNSHLYLVQEALDQKGQWRRIEAPPTSWCGNSFHRVFLKPNQYWQFPAITYDGPIKTKIRFRLDRVNGEQSVLSNTIDGAVTPNQMAPRRSF